MFLSLIELNHKRAFFVVLQGEVPQVTKCRRKKENTLSDDADEGCINRISLAAADQNGSSALNKQPSLWNMKSFDTLVTIS